VANTRRLLAERRLLQTPAAGIAAVPGKDHRRIA
jgi:hypothetical protein